MRIRVFTIALTSLLLCGCTIEVSSPKSEPIQPRMEMGPFDMAVADQGHVIDHGVDRADGFIVTDASRVNGDVVSSDAFIADAVAPTEAFFDPAWQRRVRLNLSNDDITEIVEDVVVFVRIPRELEDSGTRLENALDLRFVDKDGTVLPHRVNFSNDQEMHAWVRLARFDPSTAQSLWLYYDNPEAAESGSGYNPEAPASGARLWTETDLSVLHMDSESQGFRPIFKDSSGSNHRGHFTAGRVSGRPNEGEFGHIIVKSVPFSSAVEISGPDNDRFTFEALTVHLSYRGPEPIDDNGYLFGDPDYSGAQFLLQLRGSSTIRVIHKVPLALLGIGSVVLAEVPLELVEPDSYLHVSFTFGRDHQFLMVNDAFYDFSASEETVPAQSFVPWNQPLLFGSGLEAGIDEIHVMTEARSEDWLRLRQRSLLGTLLTFGEPEVAPDFAQ